MVRWQQKLKNCFFEGKTTDQVIESIIIAGIDKALDSTPVSPSWYIRYAIAKPIAAFLMQFMTDGMEKMVDTAIEKLTDKSRPLLRKAMENRPDIQAMFDIPDSILDMLDKTGKAKDGQKRITQFMDQYSNKLEEFLRKAQEALEGISPDSADYRKEWLSLANTNILEIFKGELGQTAAEQALLIVRDAYKTKCHIGNT